MKKTLLLFAIFFALGQSAFADIFAYTYQGQTLRYSIGLNGNAGVVGYFEYLNPRGPIGSLEIPATVSYGGTIYSVTGISYEAFHNCDSLTSVTIPHSVTSIGGYAFGGCDGLTSVVFNADNCTTASQGTLYLYPFSGCANITNFTFGDNVKVIPGGLCAGLSSLASVNIPDSVTSIGNYAFYNCSGLTSVTVPNSVISIGQYAFYNCSNLASVDIGNSVAPIGAYAFANCSSLTSVNLGNSVTHIYYRAYYNCSSLTSVTIPQSVTYIDSYAFGNCSGLTTVVFNADSCTHAGGQGQNYVIESPFKNSANITNFTFGANVKVIPNYLCYGLSELTSVTIPDSVTWIGFKAFYNCSNLDSVIMLPITAPLLAYNDVFQNNSATRKFYIPCGSYNSYSSVNGYWTSFLQEPDPAYTIAVSVNNTSYGCATNTPVTCAEQTIISAIANNHYHFDHWSNGSTANPDTIILTSNLAVTAHFVPDQYTVTGVSSDTAKGSVSGSATVDYLSTVTLTATANDGYHFVQWQDGNTQNPRTIVATMDRLFTATFNYNQYAIILNVDSNIHGSVAGGGSYNYLSEQTIAATANYGYHFTAWSDGDTNNPRTITLTQDTSFTALFGKNIYTITVNSGDTAKGTVTGSTSTEYLDSVTITANPNYGHHFTAWNDGNTDNPRIIVATRDSIFTATFDYNQYTITLNVDTNIHGSVIGSGSYNYLSEQTITATVNYGYHFTAWSDGDTNNPRTITLTQDTIFTALFAKNIYTITAISADTIKGSVNGSTSIEYLDSVTIGAIPNYGYHFTAWNDGNADNPRIIVATRDSLFTATFDHNQYTITLNVDTNIHGSVIGSGSYNYLSEQTITATAAYGYHFTAWSDGDTNNPRTITLTQDTIFTAQFAKNTYTITAISADTIRGSVIGSTSIEYLDSVTIMANPNYGYHFTAWNDGNTDNPRIIVATRDSVFTASFVYNQYTITLNVDSDIHGSVVGGGSFNYLSEQTIIATANYGYHFTAWSDGDTNNPRTITLTQDTGFTALFAKNQYTLTLQSDDVAHGSVIGGGVFDYLDTVAIEATAVEHYHFVLWNDGNTDNPRQYVLIGNDTLIAIFAIDTHHVSVESCNIAFGSVEGSGDFEYGTPATVTATAYSGYQFVRWSNGDTHNPYTFAVLQDTTLVAIFEAETQGIDDVIADAVNVYTLGGQIVVETNLKDEISIYDIVGRKVDGGRKTRFDVPASGVYLFKIGSSPTQKVVVVK